MHLEGLFERRLVEGCDVEIRLWNCLGLDGLEQVLPDRIGGEAVGVHELVVDLVHDVNLALLLSRGVWAKKALAWIRGEVVKEGGICRRVRLEGRDVCSSPEGRYLWKVKWFDGVYYRWRFPDKRIVLFHQ